MVFHGNPHGLLWQQREPTGAHGNNLQLAWDPAGTPRASLGTGAVCIIAMPPPAGEVCCEEPRRGKQTERKAHNMSLAELFVVML